MAELTRPLRDLAATPIRTRGVSSPLTIPIVQLDGIHHP